MMTKLILIRHGQTDWNLQKRYCGFIDIELNNEGRKQADLTREKVAGESIDKVYSSDRTRAAQTAEIIFKNHSIEKIADLREIHFGCLEGLNHEQIMELYPDIYQKWIKEPFNTTLPEAENLLDFRKRVVSAIESICDINQNKTIACVCHGGTISVFITHILKINDFWNYIPESASISIIEYKNNKAEIKLFNNAKY